MREKDDLFNDYRYSFLIITARDLNLISDKVLLIY
jgi:hypothetical protein